MKQLYWFSPALLLLSIATVANASDGPKPSLAEDVAPNFESCPVVGQFYGSTGECQCPDGQTTFPVDGVDTCVEPCPEGQVHAGSGQCVCEDSGASMVDGVCENVQCKYYSGKISYCVEADNSAAANRLGIQCRGGNALTLGGDATQLSCIDTVLANCQARFPQGNINRNTQVETSEIGSDDALLFCFGEIADQSLGRAKGTTTAWFQQTLKDTNWGQYGYLAQMNYVMDDNCEGVKLPRGEEVCGNVDVYAFVSPVSLLMNDSVDIEQNQAVADFPLELGKSGNWYTWKASAEAPLLVIDAAHSGQISSAAQLFGSWTFGGQPVAANTAASTPTPWENGFQAMAVLDKNGDGALRGEELATLALWFDANRDGHSDSGEVRPLFADNITALFYRGAARRSGTNDLYLQIGYERTIDGKVTAGRAVDWFGERSSSPIESAMKEQMRAVGKQPAPESALLPQAPAGAVLQPISGSTKSDFDGMWKWEMDPSDSKAFKEQGYSVNGIFALRAHGDSLQGVTVLEAPAVGPKGKRYSQMAMFPIRGTTGQDASNAQTVKFQTLGKHAVTENTAELSSSKQFLFGESLIQVKAANGSAKSIRYRWKAKRM